MARRVGGGRLVYAKPLRIGDRAVIPVSRVRVRGGFGFGGRPDEDGAGGGGTLGARPARLLQAGPQGARHESIPPARGRAGASAAGPAARGPPRTAGRPARR